MEGGGLSRAGVSQEDENDRRMTVLEILDQQSWAKAVKMVSSAK